MTLGVSLLFPSFHGVRGPVNAEMLSTYSTPYIVYMHDIILCQDWGWRTIILNIQPYEHSFEGYS